MCAHTCLIVYTRGLTWPCQLRVQKTIFVPRARHAGKRIDLIFASLLKGLINFTRDKSHLVNTSNINRLISVCDWFPSTWSPARCFMGISVTRCCCAVDEHFNGRNMSFSGNGPFKRNSTPTIWVMSQMNQFSITSKKVCLATTTHTFTSVKSECISSLWKQNNYSFE